MDSMVSNTFLFGFEGRINRAKYWYALFANSAACLVFLSMLAFAIGGIFGANVKSVYVGISDFLHQSFPFSVSFRNAGPTSPATLLFYVAGMPIFVVAVWILAATSIKRLHDRNKKAGGLSRSSLLRVCSTGSRTGWTIRPWRFWSAPSVSA